MKRGIQFTACFLAAGMMFAGMGSLQAAAEENKNDMTGELIFAQCEEYINVRSDSSKKADIVAKIYNNDSATVVGKDGSWYEIQSGNATGYVKAKFFATGEEADVIAAQVAYNVAVVYPDELNVRTEPSDEAEVIKVAYKGEELEAVASENGWTKVALGGDVYGYVHSDYVEFKTYYPTAETLEEEQARLAEEEAAETETEAAEAEYIETEAIYTETEAPSYTEPSYETEAPSYTEPVYTETEAPQTEPVYTETEAPQTEPVYTETEAPQTEAPQTEPVYTETEAPQTEAPAQTEEVYEDSGLIYDSELGEDVYVEGSEDAVTYEETTDTEASASSATGQQIVDYATQFVGNSYVWGGTSLTEGADCSGFTQTVFGDNGIDISRTAEEQSHGGTNVDMNDLQAGDLLFYGDDSSIGHVGIYMGDGQIVHAANSNSGITISNYDYETPVSASRYW